MPSTGSSSAVRSLQGQVAAARRWGRDSLDLDRDYAAERLAEHVAKVVDAAPPLDRGSAGSHRRVASGWCHMSAPTLPTARMFHEARDQDQARHDPDHLIRETHAVFDRFGVQVSPGRVIKLVRTYVRRVQGDGVVFADYLAQVAVGEHQRRLVADELSRVTAYVDPTGESAVNNVVRGGTR